MELNSFIDRLQKNPALHQFLPLNEGLLLPMFSMSCGELCAHFLTCAVQRVAAGMELSAPGYHIAAIYPGGELVCMETLQYHPAFRQTDFKKKTLVEPPDPVRQREIRDCNQRALALANEVLSQWEQTRCDDFTAYHRQLAAVLTPLQNEMYHRVVGCD